jgi:TonB-linked SusC/RagA family outer membrane protein
MKITQQTWLAMRLTIIIMTFTLLQVSARTYSQQVTLEARNAGVKDLFTKIEKQTGYVFFYKVPDIQAAKPVSASWKQAPLQKVLEEIFKDQPLHFRIQGKTIYVSPKALAQEAAAPVTDVRGVVKDENGKPAAGVGVRLKGSSTGTTTNEDGEFILRGIDNNATLEFSAVNLQAFELKINGKNDLVVTLKNKISELGDVAVTVNTGYQSIPKERATGSFAQPEKQVFERRVSKDVISRLEGITSGLVFNRDKTGNPSLSIRGRSTINASTDPLIVVDNFPYDGDINNINPNDIESITLLKDAAAASIWGVRAGNGVIVITTKKGKYNQPLQVELNSNVTIGQKPDLFYDRNFLNSDDFINNEIFLFGKGYYSSDFTNSNRPPISAVVEILNNRKLGLISASDSAQQIGGLRKNDFRNDLSNYFYQQSVLQQYSLNVSGGSKNSSYYLSAGFDKNRSNLVRNENNRVTVNSYINYNPVRNLEIYANINFTQSTTYNNNTSSQIVTAGPNGYGISPYVQLQDAQGKALPIVKDYRALYADTMGAGRFLNWRYFPLNELAMADNSVNAFDIRIPVGIKYKIMEGLHAELKYQYERAINEVRTLSDQDSYFSRDLVNRYTAIRPDGTLKYNIPAGGILNLGDANLSSSRFRGQVNYDKTLAKHRISAIAGFEVTEVKSFSNGSRTYGFDPNNNTFTAVNYDSLYALNPSNSAKVPDNTSFNSTLDRYRSYFGNAAYTYLSRYTVSASGRIDQSNLFGVKTNQKSVPLWSLGGKWDISREKFYTVGWLPVLSLRATYGYNGNLNKTISAYVLSAYASNSTYNNGIYANVISPGDPDLRWEKVGIFNIGLDFAVLNKRISGSFDYYHKNGVDLIGDIPLPSSTGFATAKINYANLRGHGYDLTIRSLNIDRVFKWQTTLLLSLSKDKVTKYNGGTGSSVIIGNPVNSIYSYRWGGLDPNTGDPMGYSDDTTKSKNYGALTAVTNDKKIYNGPANPITYGSLINVLSWKNFSISFTISYKGGYFFQRSSINYFNLNNRWAGNADYAQRWQKPGDELITPVPSVVYPVNQARDNFYSGSSVLVEKGDHLRLNDASFSFDLYKSNWKKLPVERLQLYIYANNLGILWRANKYGIDPDVQSGYPNPSTISLGLRTSF